MPNVIVDWLAEHVEIDPKISAENLAADFVKVGLEEEEIHSSGLKGPIVIGRVLQQIPEEQSNGKTINWCVVDVGNEHNVTLKDIEKGGEVSSEITSKISNPETDLIGRGIICGAHNFKVNDLVAVTLPGAELPTDSGEPFKIAARKTYGHISDGMIASGAELGLSDQQLKNLGITPVDHGIIVFEPNSNDAKANANSNDTKANAKSNDTNANPKDPNSNDTKSNNTFSQLQPGDNVLSILGLDGETLEINITPDRGYCFNYRGLGREYMHSTKSKFIDNFAKYNQAALEKLTPNLEQNINKSGDSFEVQVDDQRPINGNLGCTNFVTRTIKNVNPNAATPQFIVDRLEGMGMRSISLAVDITNYVMLDLGQPLHAYDAANLEAPIVVRRANTGENITTLDDANHILSDEDLLITDSPNGKSASRIQGIAGVMGGAQGEINDATTDIILEAAYFDKISVARTSHLHKIHSAAAFRYERGTDPLLPLAASQMATEMICEFGGGSEAGFYWYRSDDFSENLSAQTVAYNFKRVTEYLGTEIPTDTQIEILREIGCVVKGTATDKSVDVTLPTWRPDLAENLDNQQYLIEEVARIYGYDKIPLTYPSATNGTNYSRSEKLTDKAKQTLAGSGLTEVITYPFVAENEFRELTFADQFPANFWKKNTNMDDVNQTARVNIANPLNAQKKYLRTYLLSTLLEVAELNINRKNSEFNIFETGKVFLPNSARFFYSKETMNEDQDADVPNQPNSAAAIFTTGNMPFVSAMESLETLAKSLFLEVKFANVTSKNQFAILHPGRSASVQVGGALIGYVGEFTPAIQKAYGLPKHSAGFEINFDKLISTATSQKVYQFKPLPTYPAASEDLAFVMPADKVIGDVLKAAKTAHPMIEDVKLIDIYQPEDSENSSLKSYINAIGDQIKSVAMSFTFRKSDGTLSPDELRAIRSICIKKIETELKAKFRDA
ncbi:MAG: phenylalanine--tRNA ligase subunit beta [Bifidobacteriaceae bacterium]|jgi:phenylalanyl-tRNA synthetase beta chain|nr:phenylalanine--tRNA ligase subunit beta [Bifidobacteriaceae bacterium]